VHRLTGRTDIDHRHAIELRQKPAGGTVEERFAFGIDVASLSSLRFNSCDDVADQRIGGMGEKLYASAVSALAGKISGLTEVQDAFAANGKRYRQRCGDVACRGFKSGSAAQIDQNSK